jgi:hypothetical protein
MKADLGLFIHRIDAQRPPERSARPILRELKTSRSQTPPADSWSRKQTNGPRMDEAVLFGPQYVAGIELSYYEPPFFDKAELSARWSKEEGTPAAFEGLIQTAVEVNKKFFFRDHPDAQEFPVRDWGPYSLRVANFGDDARSLAEALFKGTGQLDDAIRILERELAKLFHDVMGRTLAQIKLLPLEPMGEPDPDATRVNTALLGFGPDAKRLEIALRDGVDAAEAVMATLRDLGLDTTGHIDLAVGPVTPLVFAGEADLIKPRGISLLQFTGRDVAHRIASEVSDAAAALDENKKKGE